MTTMAAVLACGLALAATADLDATFDGDGKVATDYGADDYAQDVAVQSDGKIVAVGTTAPKNTESILDPNRKLAEGTWYIVKVRGGVEDLAGNTLDAGKPTGEDVWSFRTKTG